jgi:hypothetical protein
MDKNRTAYKALIGKPNLKRRHRHRWEDNRAKSANLSLLLGAVDLNTELRKILYGGNLIQRLNWDHSS